MPCGMADRRPKGGWAGSDWAIRVTCTVRTVLQAAISTGHANIILGAFGCGAFGNPARHVAAIFREQIESVEFRGYFANIIFAIIDPVGTGNLRPFQQELRSINCNSVLVSNGSPSVGTCGEDESDESIAHDLTQHSNDMKVSAVGAPSSSSLIL